VACCVLALALRDAASAVWLLAQLMHSIIPFRTTTAERLEAWAWRQWEEGGASSTMPIQVPEVSAAAVWADLERPFIVRGLLDGAAALENRSWLRTPPVGELLVPYYSDASGGALRPDAVGTVARVVAAIEAGGPQKLGTELVFRRHPELLTELGLTAPLARLWKEFTAARCTCPLFAARRVRRPLPERAYPRIQARLFGRSPFEPRRLGTTLTVPLFLGTGASDGATHVRTDFHAEPIGRSVHPSTHYPSTSPARTTHSCARVSRVRHSILCPHLWSDPPAVPRCSSVGARSGRSFQATRATVSVPAWRPMAAPSSAPAARTARRASPRSPPRAPRTTRWSSDPATCSGCPRGRGTASTTCPT